MHLHWKMQIRRDTHSTLERRDRVECECIGRELPALKPQWTRSVV